MSRQNITISHQIQTKQLALLGNTKRFRVLRPYTQNSHTAHKPLQIIKALTATGCGKQKETLMVTYKAVIIPALEKASSLWSPLASFTSINKLEVM